MVHTRNHLPLDHFLYSESPALGPFSRHKQILETMESKLQTVPHIHDLDKRQWNCCTQTVHSTEKAVLGVSFGYIKRSGWAPGRLLCDCSLRKFENISVVFKVRNGQHWGELLKTHFLGLKVGMCRNLVSMDVDAIGHSLEELQVNVVSAFEPGVGPIQASRKYQHLGVAGEAGCTRASGIMMAHSYLSTIMGNGPVKPDMAIRLPHHTSRANLPLCSMVD